MAPAKSGARAKRQIRKPALSLVAESPSRPLSAFRGFDKQSSPIPWSRGEEKAPGKPSATQDALYVDTYAPKKRAQLAVHKKKVEDVAGWLRDALYGKPILRKYRRILCLSGPAGSGKSALIHALAAADDLDYDVAEWIDQNRQTIADTSGWDGRSFRGDAESSTRQSRFSNFLSQSSRFSALSLDADTDAPNVSSGNSTATRKRHRVILVDDIPNVQYEPTRHAFRIALTSFIVDSRSDDPPLIIILSESTPRFDEWDPSGRSSSWKERSEETMNVRSVIPESVRNHPAFMNVAFNPVAPTLLRKTLLEVITQERKCDNPHIPAPTSTEAKECVDAVVAVSNGDVRSALHALQMLLHGGRGTKKGARSAKRMANGRPKHSLSMMEAMGRESSLAIFHALGRVLYNKRFGDPGDNDDVGEVYEEAEAATTETIFTSSQLTTSVKEYELPAHLAHRARRKTRVNVEMLWRTMPVDAGTLQVYLHQNYPQFCDSIEQCCELVDHLSYAEILKTSHEEWLHAVISDHYAFQITTRGTLMALPTPVPRIQGGQKLRGAAYFDYRRRLNRVRDTLNALSSAAQLGTRIDDGTSVEESARPFLRSTLAESGVELLATEVLAITARYRKLPADVDACLLFNYTTKASATQTSALDDDLMMDVPSEEESTFTDRSQKPDLLSGYALEKSHDPSTSNGLLEIAVGESDSAESEIED